MEVFILIGPIIIGVAIYMSITSLVKLTGWRLQRRFARLGRLEGKRKEEILRLAGEPHSYSAANDGKGWWHWNAGGHYIALIFDGEVCESMVQVRPEKV